jgi:ribosomal protein L35
MKIKTKKILVKRFKKTKNNKVLHKIQGVSHFMSKRNSNRRNKVKGIKKLDDKVSKKFKNYL